MTSDTASRARDTRRRDEVLRLVRVSPQPISVAELAAGLLVHPNTVRFHLDALEAQQRIERVASTATGPGRPRTRYRARVSTGARGTELFARILLAGLGTGDEAMARAGAAGFAWGRDHRRRRATSPASPVDRIDALADQLDDLGFAAHRTDEQELELHACPFLDMVDGPNSLACAVHAGLMRGLVAGADANATRLEPFIRPGVCRVRVAAA